MSLTIAALPEEMLRIVFSHLTFKDLNSVVLVSRLWREIGEDTSLWTNLDVILGCLGDLTKLDIKRLQKIQKIQVNGRGWSAIEVEEVFKALVTKPADLNKMSVSSETVLYSVNPDLLATVLNRPTLKWVSMGYAIITEVQAQSLFDAFLTGNRLKKLEIDGNNLSSVDPEVLAAVVTRIQIVSIRSKVGMKLNISAEQMDTLFTACCEEGIKLKKLDVSGLKVATVNPSLLSVALTSLEELSIPWTNMSHLQLSMLFEAICQGSGCRLKRLNISHNNLTNLEPAVLCTALEILEKLEMDWSRITVDQVIAIFGLICQGKQMKTLNLSGLNLTSISPKLLAKAVNTLDRVITKSAKMTPEQTQLLFTAMGHPNSRLRSINISENHLSSVDPKVLAKAICQREKVLMDEVLITSDHGQALMEAISCSHKLKILHMAGVKLTSGVEPEVLAKAVMNVKEVHMMRTMLDREQTEALFTRISQEDQIRLQILNVKDINLSSIKPAVLANSVHRLENVKMLGTNLTPAQVTFLLRQWQDCKDESKLKRLELSRSDLKEIDKDFICQVEKEKNLVVV